MPDEIPFGPYALLSRLGRGGMGETWRAVRRDPHGVTKEVAIKLIRRGISDEPSFIEAFIAEARVSTRLSHANIAQVFEFGQVDGEHYMAMELVLGRSLASVLQAAAEKDRHTLPPGLAVYLISEALKGLHHAHTRVDERGERLAIVHRDVSPENILLGWEGEVKVIDFGIAKARLASRPHTQVGTVKGKPAYFSPEQARGENVDAQTDVWAAGVVLYLMLSGRLPSDGDTQQLARNAAFGRPLPLSEAAPDLDPELLEVASKALELERARRYSTAAQFQQALAPVLHRLGGPSPQSFAAGTMSWLFRHELMSMGRTVVVPKAVREVLEAPPTTLPVAEPVRHLDSVGEELREAAPLAVREGRTTQNLRTTRALAIPRNLAVLGATVMLALSLVAGLLVLNEKTAPRAPPPIAALPPPEVVAPPVAPPLPPRRKDSAVEDRERFRKKMNDTIDAEEARLEGSAGSEYKPAFENLRRQLDDDSLTEKEIMDRFYDLHEKVKRATLQ